MRILEVCPFSGGGCGVWARALAESKEFKKQGHEVVAFTSDREKGTRKRMPLEADIEGIKVKRFTGYYYPFTDNVISWFVIGGAQAELKRLMMDEQKRPDIIITHLLHPHSASIARALAELKRIHPGLQAYLIPHAPFNVKRPAVLRFLTVLWKNVLGKDRKTLHAFNKVISIVPWEAQHLHAHSVSKDMILSIPNGLPEVYFDTPLTKSRPRKDVLFMGRIAPVKNIELLIAAAKKLPEVQFTIMGPPEPAYLQKLKNSSQGLPNVHFDSSMYDVKKAIRALDDHTIFVLPSKREAMPQVLLEAMARRKIVIASATDGGKALIQHGTNGFLFPIGDVPALVRLIEKNKQGKKAVQQAALATAKKYAWSTLSKRYVRLFNT